MQEARVAAPVLSRPQVTHLTGRVAGLDWGSKGLRVILDQVRSGSLPDPPARVRILVQKGAEGLRVGQGVGLTAQLMPPPGPAAPGDNDFGRAAFLAGIGATGFSYGAPQSVPLAHPPGVWDRLMQFVEAMRVGMTLRIRARLPRSEGAIASAIITGERGGIDPEDEAALRDAGLAHVLAIAGLHMALVGAGLFWLTRAVLATLPSLALAFPIKKWAAAAAICGAGFYIVISGASASATRAFVMLAMMLLAILLDRPALSMRSLGLAAAILLLARPVAITEPGFQMSFAAVASLVAVAEWEQRRARLVPRGWLYRHARGIVLTSLVASFATLPFAMYYFGRATHYAVLGNLLAMPVMGLVTMPSAALSVAAMPFGLEHGTAAADGLEHRRDAAAGTLCFGTCRRGDGDTGLSAFGAGVDHIGRIMGPVVAARLALVGPVADFGGYRSGADGATAGYDDRVGCANCRIAGDGRASAFSPPAERPFCGRAMVAARWRRPRLARCGRSPLDAVRRAGMCRQTGRSGDCSIVAPRSAR